MHHFEAEDVKAPSLGLVITAIQGIFVNYEGNNITFKMGFSCSLDKLKSCPHLIISLYRYKSFFHCYTYRYIYWPHCTP